MIFHCPICTSSGINIIIIIIIIIKVMGECVMVKGLYEGDGMVWKGDMMSVHLMDSCVLSKGTVCEGDKLVYEGDGMVCEPEFNCKL